MLFHDHLNACALENIPRIGRQMRQINRAAFSVAALIGMRKAGSYQQDKVHGP